METEEGGMKEKEEEEKEAQTKNKLLQNLLGCLRN